MELIGHGGACCGIFHIHSMGYQGPEGIYHASVSEFGVNSNRNFRTFGEALERLVNTFDTYYNEGGRYFVPQYAGRGGERILEIVLTDRQQEVWHEKLVELGFRRVVRFLNANSGNHVNIYYRHTGGFEMFDVVNQAEPEQVLPAFPPREQAEGIPPAPVNPPIEIEEYYANLRLFGRRGPFNTEAEARAAYPRCRTFERRVIAGVVDAWTTL